MDQDEFADEFNQAFEIGLENQAILDLAKAWCELVGNTTGGHMGVGMIEQATGLPVSGGSLRCEHAKGPTSFGMKLIDSAVDFYETNCVGCTHRHPTTATEHLGTYAALVLAEREKQHQAAEKERELREGRRQERRNARRLAFGLPDPSGQSLLDLIERVDSENADIQAEKLLLRHAEMAPGDFSDELLAHLATEAVAIGNRPLLESVIAVFERDGRPDVDQMVQVAFNAITVGVARRACGRVIATHARSFDVSDATIGAIVQLAAGHFDISGPHDWTGGEPAALLRLFEVTPARAIAGIASRLVDAEPWVRSAAAQASRGFIAARPAAALPLLPALLDAAVIPEKFQYFGDPSAAEGARNVIGDILIANPIATASEINERIRRADTASLRRLWECYDEATRSRLHDPDALSPEAGRAIGDAASELLDQKEVDPELARAIADTLTVMCSYHAKARSLSFEQLLRLVKTAAQRYSELDATDWAPPKTATPEEAYIARLDRESQRTLLYGIVTELKDTLGEAAKHGPAEFVGMVVSNGWPATTDSALARSALVDLIGEVITEQEDLDRVGPLLQESIHSTHNRERAEAIIAFGVLAGRGLTIPVESVAAILAAIDDQYLIVAQAVVRAIAGIEVPADKRPKVVDFLVSFAAGCGPKRTNTSDVLKALWTAWRLSMGQPYERDAQSVIVHLIASLPSSEASEIVDRFKGMEGHPDWPIAALAALKLDPDPQWRGIHDSQRFNILRRLASIDTAAIAPFFDDLVSIGKQRTPEKTGWVWAVSDVLALHGEHERAANVCDYVVDAMPDTREYRPRRRYARINAINHHLNAATAAGDTVACAKLLQEWSALSADAGRE